MANTRVCIRHVASGEERIDCGEWKPEWGDADQFQFQWLENNYSCDCNRHLQFLRAGGPGPQDDPHWNSAEHPCGSEAYRVAWLEFDGMRFEGDVPPSTVSETP